MKQQTQILVSSSTCSCTWCPHQHTSGMRYG